jgi:hypothetical protein
MRPIVLIAVAACAFAQAPRFEARDVRPQGSAEPRPLLPGIGVWIFGENLARVICTGRFSTGASPSTCR